MSITATRWQCSVPVRRPRGRDERRRVLLTIGIAIALALHAVFILLGATLLAAFSFMFLVFGVTLVATAVQLYRHRDQDPTVEDNAVVGAARRLLPITDRYDEGRVVTRVSGRRAFALLGLRALYFLVSGLLDRLVYLSTGLAATRAPGPTPEPCVNPGARTVHSQLTRNASKRMERVPDRSRSGDSDESRYAGEIGGRRGESKTHSQSPAITRAVATSTRSSRATGPKAIATRISTGAASTTPTTASSTRMAFHLLEGFGVEKLSRHAEKVIGGIA